MRHSPFYLMVFLAKVNKKHTHNGIILNLSIGFISVIVSTALLVLFAEIIPQAIFSKHGLAIGALFAYPVRILIVLWYIIAWPIAKFLDYMLGKHTGFVYNLAGKNTSCLKI